MKNIVNLLFEAKKLKKIPRSGYHFLGAGKESVAEHSFSVSFIGFVMAQMEPDVDALRLIAMCLVHDLPEARTGDLNYVQKKYVTADENKAMNEITRKLPFGTTLSDLIAEFNARESMESKLAHDADQLALILDLKALSDIGYEPSKKWLPYALKRLETKTGQDLAESIMTTEWDAWWLENFVDSSNKNK
ncbi:MAG: HD domain-containing protein [Deltaproteobacteria bacterium]|nr:HD domain-containing protein [Deltaproteobacteria bacterium]